MYILNNKSRYKYGSTRENLSNMSKNLIKLKENLKCRDFYFYKVQTWLVLLQTATNIIQSTCLFLINYDSLQGAV